MLHVLGLQISSHLMNGSTDLTWKTWFGQEFHVQLCSVFHKTHLSLDCMRCMYEIHAGRGVTVKNETTLISHILISDMNVYRQRSQSKSRDNKLTLTERSSKRPQRGAVILSAVWIL